MTTIFYVLGVILGTIIGYSVRSLKGSFKKGKPLNIGDTVYIIDEAEDECQEDYVLAVKIHQFIFNEDGLFVELKLPLGMRHCMYFEIGKTVFLTEEEAENALKERKENGK